MKPVTVMLTRPTKVKKNFTSKQLKNDTVKAVSFPLINILEYEIESFLIKLNKIGNINTFIFISKNSIRTVMPLIYKFYANYRTINYVTIGPGSASELKKFGINNIYYSLSKFPNSNKILSLSILKKVKNKIIILFKGNDGNNLLFNKLKDRKAIVHNFISYSRDIPSLRTYIRFAEKQELDFIFVSSLESLKNFFF